MRGSVLDSVRGKINEGMFRDGIPKSELWKLKNAALSARAGKHDVYWGCHACDLKPGHFGECECYCGKIPSRTAMFWGDDFPGFSEKEFVRRKNAKTDEDRIINEGMKYFTPEEVKAARRAKNKRAQVKKAEKARARKNEK